jgi:hypothetical protein
VDGEAWKGKNCIVISEHVNYEEMKTGFCYFTWWRQQGARRIAMAKRDSERCWRIIIPSASLGLGYTNTWGLHHCMGSAWVTDYGIVDAVTCAPGSIGWDWPSHGYTHLHSQSSTEITLLSINCFQFTDPEGMDGFVQEEEIYLQKRTVINKQW